MKKKLLVILLALTGTGSFLNAQNNSLGKNDPDAKKVLDEVSVKMKGYKAVQASFTLTIEDAKGNPQGSKKGTLFMKGNNYHLIITGQEVYCDNKNVWTYDKSANEVTITKFDPAGNSVSPQRLFTNFYDKDFLYKLNGEKKMGTKTVQEIEMTPVDKTKNFYKIYLYIDKSAKTLYSSKVLDKNGNKYTYTINSFNGNSAISDASFVFDKTKYPGVEEVDLRN